jgi:hypothetical protein
VPSSNYRPGYLSFIQFVQCLRRTICFSIYNVVIWNSSAAFLVRGANNSYTQHSSLFYLQQRFAFRFVLYMRSHAILALPWAMAIAAATSQQALPHGRCQLIGTVRATPSSSWERVVMALRASPTHLRAAAAAPGHMQKAPTSRSVSVQLLTSQ